MAIFDDFLSEFPMAKEQDFSPAELKVFSDRVPESVTAYLEGVGLASSRRFFFTLAPDEGVPFLEAWGVNPASAQAFLCSAFGLLVFATKSSIGTIDPFSGRAQLWEEPSLAFLMLSMNLVHLFEEFESRQLGATPVSRGHPLLA
jgi:hypothetical protein